MDGATQPKSVVSSHSREAQNLKPKKLFKIKNPLKT